MHVYKQMPQQLKTECVIDPSSDKKLRLYLNLSAVAAAAVLVFIGILFVPITSLYDVGGIGRLILRTVLIIIGEGLYYFAHELVHSLVSDRLTGNKSKIVLKRLWLCSGCESIFTLKGYLLYTFAPIVIIGTALLILNIALPDKLFWQVYIMQIINIAGAAGDFYAAYRLVKEKKQLAVRDDGTKITYWI